MLAPSEYSSVAVSPSHLLSLFATNLLWNLFLTSTAIHAVALISSPISALWLRYSMFIRDAKLILLQSYAVSMQTFFLVAFVFYRTKKRRLIRMICLMFGLFFILFYYVHTMGDEEGKMFIGRLASTAQMAGSLVCPYLIYRAISTRVIDFVPLAPVAFTWVMELHAIIYSIGIDDFYMLLANTTFFCMDGSLLAMFFIFPTEKPQPKVEMA